MTTATTKTTLPTTWDQLKVLNQAELDTIIKQEDLDIVAKNITETREQVAEDLNIAIPAKTEEKTKPAAKATKPAEKKTPTKATKPAADKKVSTKDTTTRVACRIENATHKKLQAEMKKTGTSRAAVMKKIIEAHYA